MRKRGPPDAQVVFCWLPITAVSPSSEIATEVPNLAEGEGSLAFSGPSG